jgi:hypothetical protein
MRAVRLMLLSAPWAAAVWKGCRLKLLCDRKILEIAEQCIYHDIATWFCPLWFDFGVGSSGPGTGRGLLP